ncbi:MAG: hypothetical protein JNM93_06705 [Bacteriovoracaceae bacterium]|nr:hypothetical protein [Bacteriovoracaceae bacterium]
MKNLNRRELFKTALLSVTSVFIGSKLISSAQADACGDVKKPVGDLLAVDPKTKKGKLQYVEVSTKAGKSCSNCKFFCASNQVCSLAAMVVGGKHPKVLPGAYCSMHAVVKA